MNSERSNKKYLTKIIRALFNQRVINSFFILLFLYIGLIIAKWLLFEADWRVIITNLDLFAFGRFPKSEIWRPTLWMLCLSSLTIYSTRQITNKYIRKCIYLGWIFVIPIGILLHAGGIFISSVSTSLWGGLSLTLLITLCSSALAFPLGIFLALGRQSNDIFIMKISSIYIDYMRSVPLIAVLFFGQLLTPLFLPIEVELNRVVRSIIAFTLFLSAYLAEDIRGGLQSIPKNQVETAEVLGLNKFQTIKHIILPQALRISIPALTNQAVGLLQNTSLLAILGIIELLGISRSILANPDFIGRHLEVYAWLAVLYWIIGTVIALLAKNIEKSFITSERAKR